MLVVEDLEAPTWGEVVVQEPLFSTPLSHLVLELTRIILVKEVIFQSIKQTVKVELLPP